MKKKYRITIYRDWCKGCGLCVAYCPVKILRIDEERKVSVMDEDRCVGCLMCEYRCPDFAIDVKEREEVKV
ncbi:ferredoxin [bacterium]|nr:MAG: ferredoxin [bacterium]RKZ27574.1 MAG: ferredoxin [bacterium]